MGNSTQCWSGSIAVVVILVVGCAGQNRGNTQAQRDVDAESDGATPTDTEAPSEADGLADSETSTDGAGPCDPLMAARCALPWPSSKYLAEDADRVTGYTLSFEPTSLPINKGGDQVDPAPYRRLDGYGVGTPILVSFDDLDASALPDETAIGESMAEDAQILLYQVDGDSLRRIPYWAEVDAQAPDDAEREMLIIRPAVILRENTRYVVAMRGLRRRDGTPIEPSEAFRKLRAGETASGEPLGRRQERFDEVFSMLEQTGVSRDSLTLAWDFHTASNEALHGSMLHMRDRAFEIVGEKGPTLEFESVERFVRQSEGGSLVQRDRIGLRIEGTFRVPRFVEETTIRGTTGWTLHRGSDGLPEQNGWKRSPFWMIVPHSAINAAPGEGEATGNGEPHGLVQYGHGLLGTGAQTDGDFNAAIADEHDFVFFGATLFGMAEPDRSTAISAVADIAKFPLMADRLHQGLVEYLLLMRAMQRRFPSSDIADEYGLKLDPEDAYYSGISQGGIFGGTYMALSTDVTRGHLGVPGQNYSTLLGRSVDFAPFFSVMRNSYESRLDQLIALGAMQQLWGQTDPVSYMQHIKADPFEGTPSHDVLLAPAKGDYQVAVITNEVTARTDNEIALMSNYPRDVALVETQSFPYKGSGVVLYDFGNPWPEPGNHPPKKTELGDPHGEPRDAAWHNRQMVEFFRTGRIVNTCDEDGDPVCDPK